jgi:outer membrane protein
MNILRRALPCWLNRISIFTLLVALLISFDGRADLKQDIQAITQLINQQQGEQAFQLALKTAVEHEGDEQFDFAFGLAAQASKHYHQAVFAFERVVNAKPNWLQARYALASSYFATGNMNAAELEFTQLQQADSQNQFPHTKDYLASIALKRKQQQAHWQHQMQFGLGLDSNANSGINADSLFIPILGDVPLFASSQAQNDQFWQAQWQTSYLKPVNLQSNWYLLGQVRYADYQENSNQSRLYADAFVGWQSKFGKFKYKINGFYRPLWLDNKSYLSYYGTNAELSRALRPNLALGINGLVAKLDYQQDDLDKQQWAISSWLQSTTKHFSNKAMFSYGQERAHNRLFPHLDRHFWGINGQLMRQLSQSSVVALNLDYTRSNYQQIHPLFLQTREDQAWKASIDYQRSIDKQWTWLVQMMYLKNDSNLTLYDYQRALLSTAIQYQF